MSDLLASALELANYGWPVFPCGGAKKPCWSHEEGGHGLHDASLDPAEIRRLFAHPRAALIGVPTGEASGVDALDLDYRNGAAEWEQANLHHLPETRIHGTRSGGRHYLFCHAHGIRNSAGTLAPGCDVRGEGGYILWWPAHGVRPISEAPIGHWPDWLLPLALPKPAAPRPTTGAPLQRREVSADRLQDIIDRALMRVVNAVEGGKHFQLRNAALLLGGVQADAGFSTEVAIGWLMDALPATVRDWNAARKTAEWGLANGAVRPIEFAAPTAPDPAEAMSRKTLARTAVRLLKAGADSGAILAGLASLNAALHPPLRPEQLPRITAWAAKQLTAA